jgi:endoglucanase
MPAIWDAQWGFIRGAGGPAVCPGEWGGRFSAGSAERAWALAFAAYQKARGATDTFFWCLNPNSGDTGGLLADDWGAVGPGEAWKLALLAWVNPNPTKFDAAGSVVDVGGGPGYAPGPVPAALLEGAAAPAPAAAAPAGAPAPAPQQPATTTAPLEVVATGSGGLELSVAVTQTWAAGARTAHRADVVLRNAGPSPIPDVVFSVDAALVEQSWACERRADKGGRAEFSLPAWAVAAGGLAPGASITAGGVFFEARPEWRVGPA